ncbi:MAG: adenylate kinase [Ardenticatenia bacterium]|nr:adenylate kinase [Ardenticatenia bacterium]
MAPLHMVLLGPPGSGKGTQARFVSAHFGVAYVGAGDLLREEVTRQTPLGQHVASFLKAGDLVPLPLLLELLARRLATIPPEQGIVFDGVPRSLAQAKALDELLAQLGRHLDVVILLRVPDEVVFERLLRRGRPDDTPDIIAHRLRVYHDEIAPLVAWYRERGLLRAVDGVGAPDQVFERLRQALPTKRDESFKNPPRAL